MFRKWPYSSVALWIDIAVILNWRYGKVCYCFYWFGMVWFGWYGWYDLEWFGMVCYGLLWFVLVCHGLVWRGGGIKWLVSSYLRRFKSWTLMDCHGLSDGGVGVMTGIDAWDGWLWLAWMIGMNDWHGWLVWMTSMDDWHGWLAWYCLDDLLSCFKLIFYIVITDR